MRSRRSGRCGSHRRIGHRLTAIDLGNVDERIGMATPGAVRSSRPLATVKIDVAAPIPIASDSAAVSVKTGLRPRRRAPYRRLEKSVDERAGAHITDAILEAATLPIRAVRHGAHLAALPPRPPFRDELIERRRQLVIQVGVNPPAIDKVPPDFQTSHLEARSIASEICFQSEVSSTSCSSRPWSTGRTWPGGYSRDVPHSTPANRPLEPMQRRNSEPGCTTKVPPVELLDAPRYAEPMQIARGKRLENQQVDVP